MKLMKNGVSLLSAAAISLCVATSSEAADFSGQQVSIYAPTAPGSSLDLFLRIMGELLGKKLPGEPVVVVRNIPGGGTMTGLNAFEREAMPDGLSIAGVSISGMMNFAFEDPNAQYDLKNWVPVMLSPASSIIYVHESVGVSGPEEIAELRGKRLVYGGNSPTSGDIRAILMFEQLGIDVKTVWGIDRGPARLAFDRGEFNINFDGTPVLTSTLAEHVESGRYIPLWSMGVVGDDGKPQRDPNFPDVPHFEEVYERLNGKPLEGVEYKAWRNLQLMSAGISKVLALPAGTDDDIVQAYSEAVAALLEDPAAVEKLGPVMQGYTPNINAPIAKSRLVEAISIDDDVMEYLEEWLQRTQGVSVKR